MKILDTAICLSVLSSFCYLKSYAQEPADALRYSYTAPSGTARNQAIGGAGGSLGGDFSTLFTNPAGLGFYKTHDFVITPNVYMKKSKADYLNTNSESDENKFALGATGLVIAAPSERKGSIKTVSFGLGLNKVADFSNNIYYKGVNTSTSFSEKYLEELINNNVTNPNDAANNFPYGSSLAFNTFLIDTLQASDGSLLGYRSLADPAYGLLQENNIVTKGGISELSFGVGANTNDKFYFGGSISIPFLNYERNGYYSETDQSGDPNNNFNYFEANEYLHSKGAGVNGKFGLIFKPVESLRLGLAFHTPTFYQLTDQYNIDIVTELEGYGGSGQKHQSSLDLSGGYLESKYNITTPYRLIASASYVLHEVEDVTQQKGFITADVEYINYKSMSFSAVDKTDNAAVDYYHSLNNTIDNLYQNALNVRLGGEVKLNTFMVRLGGAYYGNPYANQDANLVKLSGGIGYRNKGMFIDLTYIYSLTKDQNYPYLLEDKANRAATLKNNVGGILATIGFKI